MNFGTLCHKASICCGKWCALICSTKFISYKSIQEWNCEFYFWYILRVVHYRVAKVEVCMQKAISLSTQTKSWPGFLRNAIGLHSHKGWIKIAKAYFLIGFMIILVDHTGATECKQCSFQTQYLIFLKWNLEYATSSFSS